MKKYVVKPSVRGMFSADVQNDTFDVVEPILSHIDWVYQMPEDGVVVLPNAGEKEVKEGDIIIVFYNSPYAKNEAIVISSDEWKENIVEEKKYNEEMKSNVKKCECDCCNECVGNNA